MSALDSYEENRVAELAPSIAGPQGEAFARAMGQEQDAETPLLRMAALSRLATDCPDDALDGCGRWMQIERFEGEEHGAAADQSGYRGRLMRGWTTWKEAGSPQALVDSLGAWGLGPATVLQNFQVSGGYAGGNYAAFKILVGPDFGVYGGQWAPTTAQKRAVSKQLLKWKSAHSLPLQVVLRYHGELLGVDFVLGESALGGTGDRITIMPRLGVDFILGEDLLGDFREY